MCMSSVRHVATDGTIIATLARNVAIAQYRTWTADAKLDDWMYTGHSLEAGDLEDDYWSIDDLVSGHVR